MSIDSTPDSLHGMATFYQEHAARCAAHVRVVLAATPSAGDEDALAGVVVQLQGQAAHFAFQARDFRNRGDALAIAISRAEDE